MKNLFYRREKTNTSDAAHTSSKIKILIRALGASPVAEHFPGSSAGKESTCNAGDLDWIPGSGRSPGEGIGYSLQHSWASLVAQMVKNPPQYRRPGFNPWVGKVPGGGHDNPL